MVLRSVVAMPLLHLDSFCTVHTLSWERDRWSYTASDQNWSRERPGNEAKMLGAQTQSRKGESGGAAPAVA